MWLDLGLASAYKLFYTVGDGYCRLCRFVQLSVITAHWKWTFSAHCLPSSICFCLFMLRPLHSSTDDSISPVTQWVYIHEVIPNHWTHLLLIGCWATVFVGPHDQSGAGEQLQGGWGPALGCVYPMVSLSAGGGLVTRCSDPWSRGQVASVGTAHWNYSWTLGALSFHSQA